MTIKVRLIRENFDLHVMLGETSRRLDYDLRISWDRIIKRFSLWPIKNGVSTVPGDIQAQYSPDGAQIVTAHRKEKSACIWDVTTGQLIQEFCGHTDAVMSAQFSPDGTKILTASLDNTARLWDVTSGRILECFVGHTDSIISGQFSPDGTKILTASLDETARLWDLADGKELKSYIGHSGSVNHAQFSPDGTKILTASSDKSVRLWDIESGEVLKIFSCKAPVNYTQFSPDSTKIVTASSVVSIWNIESGNEKTIFSSSKPINCAQFNSDGTEIVTAESDNRVRLWNTNSGESLNVFEVSESELDDSKCCINSAQFGPNYTLLTACNDGIVRIWDISEIGDTDFTGATPPNGVTVKFEPQLNSEYESGVTVDSETGQISVQHLSHLKNFLLFARIIDTNKTPSEEFTEKFRVNVHHSIKKLWLTPSKLSLYKEDIHFKFTVLAEFYDSPPDERDSNEVTIGDITDWHSWLMPTPSGGRIDIGGSLAFEYFATPDGKLDPQSLEVGLLYRKTDSITGICEVFVNLQSGNTTYSSRALVEFFESRSQSATINPIGGNKSAPWKKVPNILFIAEGFSASEEHAFNEWVIYAIDDLKKGAYSPLFGLDSGVKYWTAFIPGEAGVSVLGDYWLKSKKALSQGGSNIKMLPVPVPKAPETDGSYWSIENFLHEIGLPHPAEDSPIPDKPQNIDQYEKDLQKKLMEKCSQWLSIYGKAPPGYNTNMSDDDTLYTFAEWLKLIERRLLNEHNTPFHFAIHHRNVLDDSEASEVSNIHNEWRRRDVDMVSFLSSIRYGNEPLGETWSKGKDSGLVFVVARTSRDKGYFSPKNKLSVISLGNLSDTQPINCCEALGVDGIEHIEPEVIPHLPSKICCYTLAHELGHALDLDDEYSQDKNTTYPREFTSANVQTHQSTLDKAGLISGEKINWGQWHRIERAGLLVSKPELLKNASDGADYRLRLVKGHGKGFKENQKVYLRQRPLTHDAKVCPLTIMKVETNDVDVLRVKLEAKIDPKEKEKYLNDFRADDDWRTGSMVYLPKRDAEGNELYLVTPTIKKWISATHAPLTAPANNPSSTACEVRASGGDTIFNDSVQIPTNLPKESDWQKKDRVKRKSYVVGLYEGGNAFPCGIYHATGICLMRSQSANKLRIYGLCRVCAYLMVDRMEPTKHGLVDKRIQRNRYS